MRAKRLFDVVIVILAAPLWVPVLLVLALLVRIKLGTPVFFHQTRPGYKERPFVLIKFRTMTNECDATGALQPDSVRLTRFGRWLRGSSLDELPELINVLKGEMSLVGPRPLLMRYLERYDADQRRRHDTLPGITGWAQINGRNAISWDDKFKLDLWYLERQSCTLDVQILVQTVWRVVSRSGVSAPGEATTTEFMPSRVSQPSNTGRSSSA